MFSAYAAHLASWLLAIVPPMVAGPLFGLGLLLCVWRWFDQRDELRLQAVREALTRSRTALGAL